MTAWKDENKLSLDGFHGPKSDATRHIHLSVAWTNDNPMSFTKNSIKYNNKQEDLINNVIHHVLDNIQHEKDKVKAMFTLTAINENKRFKTTNNKKKQYDIVFMLV